MATAVRKRKKPTHRYYRAEFAARVGLEEMERQRVALGFPDGGEWMNEDGAVLQCIVGGRGYEAIWMVPIKRPVNANV
jgi:hypothetical protein